MFGMVLQDTWLYSGSIYDNIRYGRLNARKDEIIQAAKKMCIRDRSNVLDDLEISLNPQDLLNQDLNYVVNDGDLIQITRINEANIDEVNTIASNTCLLYTSLLF